MYCFILCLTTALFSRAFSFPDPGQWSASYTNIPSAILGIHKPLYAGSSIYMSVNCESESIHHKIELQWVIRQTSCFEDYLSSDINNQKILAQYFSCPMITNYFPQIRYFSSKPVLLDCSNRIHLDYINASFVTVTDKFEIPPECQNSVSVITPTNMEQYNENGSSTDSQKGSLMKEIDTHSRKRRNITESTMMRKKSNSQDVIRDLSSSISAAAKNVKTPLVAQSSSESDVIQKGSSAEKADHLSIDDLSSNDSIPNQKSIGYYSLGTANVFQTGSKLTSVDMDGIYLFILKVKSISELPVNFNISVDVAMKGEHGYLSAIDYPLIIFYGIMCILYVIYAIAWLVMSALQWRDLLRIQFWIGAVILLGLMEKAVFYAEYQSINYTGQSVQGAILFAEILSCMKRTLARMLIIIVSLGFGIVKPRLGPTLHRIIGVGAVYFCLGTIEGCLRVLKPKTDPGNQALMAGIPLAVTDSAICWWIFSSLVQTIRTLRLRRNIVKLQLYRHFTNILILSVIGSIAFMTWSIHAHKLVNCINDWKELWVDEAYWHFLFSTILCVIMILWRPTNNNQRYAFTPLLDAIDDEDDDDDNSVANDAFIGMKMRTTKNNSSISPKQDESKGKQDEDLKWVEENIPASLTDVALPSLLDSDEEIMTAKFERSKME